MKAASQPAAIRLKAVKVCLSAGAGVVSDSITAKLIIELLFCEMAIASRNVAASFTSVLLHFVRAANATALNDDDDDDDDDAGNVIVHVPVWQTLIESSRRLAFTELCEFCILLVVNAISLIMLSYTFVCSLSLSLPVWRCADLFGETDSYYFDFKYYGFGTLITYINHAKDIWNLRRQRPAAVATSDFTVTRSW